MQISQYQSKNTFISKFCVNKHDLKHFITLKLFWSVCFNLSLEYLVLTKYVESLRKV